jgi:6-pyruvoyltetrahydropterin/6-carboxytetrahydropterin synthase
MVLSGKRTELRWHCGLRDKWIPLYNKGNTDMRVRITKSFTFEMAHALQNYDGLCRNIHGHSYTLEVTVSGETMVDRSSPKLGMVMDFGDLKKIVKEHLIHRFDHALVVQKGYEKILFPDQSPETFRLIITAFQPTSENLVMHFASVLQPLFPVGIRLERLMLRETGTSFVEWLREDQ